MVETVQVKEMRVVESRHSHTAALQTGFDDRVSDLHRLLSARLRNLGGGNFPVEW